jgi:hypothetical protein
MKSTILWDITPCSPLRVNRRFGGTYHLHLQGQKNKLSKKPAWKQVAISSSETSVDTQRTTRCYIPEDGTFHGKIGWLSLDPMHVLKCLKPSQGSPPPSRQIWSKQVQRCANIQRTNKQTKKHTNKQTSFFVYRKIYWLSLGQKWHQLWARRSVGWFDYCWPRQHSHSWPQVSSRSMTKCLFSPRHVRVWEMDLLFNFGRDRSFSGGATFVAPQFQHEYIGAVTASRSLWALCTHPLSLHGSK